LQVAGLRSGSTALSTEAGHFMPDLGQGLSLDNTHC
jgi:hypothetical protein